MEIDAKKIEELCERLETRQEYYNNFLFETVPADNDALEAAALIRSLSLRVEAEKRAREEAETNSAALARALEDVSAKVDAFWNDPERPSVHRMRSKSVHELSDAQRRARSLLAPKEDTDVNGGR